MNEPYMPLYAHFRKIQERGLKVEAYDVLHALYKAEAHIRHLESAHVVTQCDREASEEVAAVHQ